MSMTCENFEIIARRLVGFTDYIYLHVMGEPLTHPELPRIIDTAYSLGFMTCITTNGMLLDRYSDALLLRAEKIHKISISLHSFERDMSGFDCYLENCIEFQKKAASTGIVAVLRLWNLGDSQDSDRFNEKVLDRLHKVYPGEWAGTKISPKMAQNCFLEYGNRFIWPDVSADDHGERRFCMGLRDQIGVLCDGTVVPCCLDSEGTIALGNLFDSSLETILHSDRAERIRAGFSDNKAVEALCRRCEFSTRFKT